MYIYKSLTKCSSSFYLKGLLEKMSLNSVAICALVVYIRMTIKHNPMHPHRHTHTGEALKCWSTIASLLMEKVRIPANN